MSGNITFHTSKVKNLNFKRINTASFHYLDISVLLLNIVFKCQFKDNLYKSYFNVMFVSYYFRDFDGAFKDSLCFPGKLSLYLFPKSCDRCN